MSDEAKKKNKDANTILVRLKNGDVIRFSNIHNYGILNDNSKNSLHSK